MCQKASPTPRGLSDLNFFDYVNLEYVGYALNKMFKIQTIFGFYFLSVL